MREVKEISGATGLFALLSVAESPYYFPTPVIFWAADAEQPLPVGVVCYRGELRFVDDLEDAELFAYYSAADSANAESMVTGAVERGKQLAYQLNPPPPIKSKSRLPGTSDSDEALPAPKKHVRSKYYPKDREE